MSFQKKEDLGDLFFSQRVAVFMDVQSLFYGCRDAHENSEARIRYLPLLKNVVGNRTLVRAVAYLRYLREADTHGFHRALNGYGFEVKAKPAKDHKDRPLSWTVGMTFDILSMRDKIDLAIVLTHEEDFADACSGLAIHGLPIELWGFDEVLGSNLKQAAAKFHFIPDQVVEVKGSRRFAVAGG
jgi:hypothetical protein